MNLQKISRASSAIVLMFALLFALSTFGVAQQYQQTNLVSDHYCPVNLQGAGCKY
jgi:hypothetical protein